MYFFSIFPSIFLLISKILCTFAEKIYFVV